MPELGYYVCTVWATIGYKPATSRKAGHGKQAAPIACRNPADSDDGLRWNLPANKAAHNAITSRSAAPARRIPQNDAAAVRADRHAAAAENQLPAAHGGHGSTNGTSSYASISSHASLR